MWVGHSYEFVSLLHTNLEKRVGGARGRVDMGTTDMTTGRRAATTALMPAVLLAALLPVKQIQFLWSLCGFGTLSARDLLSMNKST